MPSFFVYTVRPADSLLSIAHRYRTSALSIGFWNRDRYPTLDPDSTGYEPDAIQVGWHLQLIPDTTFDGNDSGGGGDPNASPDTSDPPSAAPSDSPAP
jgi:LysM domain